MNTIARNLRACLLTDGSEGSGDAWGSLRAAAEGESVNAQQTTQPAQTSDDPGYINSLVQQHCSLILAVGASPSRVALATAAGHPEIIFATPGQAGEAGPANIQHFRLGKASTEDVRALIQLARINHHS
jgi:hypothetical protein